MEQDIIITFHTYNDMLEASMIQENLKANGIDSFLEDRNALGLNPFGGVDLNIFSKDKEKAEKSIAE